jgi:hypothetical protein
MRDVAGLLSVTLFESRLLRGLCELVGSFKGALFSVIRKERFERGME